MGKQRWKPPGIAPSADQSEKAWRVCPRPCYGRDLSVDLRLRTMITYRCCCRRADKKCALDETEVKNWRASNPTFSHVGSIDIARSRISIKSLMRSQMVIYSALLT